MRLKMTAKVISVFYFYKLNLNWMESLQALRQCTYKTFTLRDHVWPWSTKALTSLGYICSNSQKYIVWGKNIDFYFMPKIIRILRSCSMKIFSKFPTINISKLYFWLVICIAKNFIWTTLKMIFSIFRFFLHPQIPDLQIDVSQTNIVRS